MRRAEVVRGLEPLQAVDVNQARGIYDHFQHGCRAPALWEKTFHELLGIFKTPESGIKAFRVLDNDANGLVDAREIIGALAVLSKGHMNDRMTLLFDVFDLNREQDMAFDECFLMIRRTLAGLRKFVGIHVPPEKVIHNMTKQVWKGARKHRDVRITVADWYVWWSSDASCRNGLKMFVWKPEDVRGLPTPDNYINVDYSRSIEDGAPDPGSRQGSKSPPPEGSKSTALCPGGIGGGFDTGKARKASYHATCGEDGSVSRPVHEDDVAVRGTSKLAVPGAR